MMLWFYSLIIVISILIQGLFALRLKTIWQTKTIQDSDIIFAVLVYGYVMVLIVFLLPTL